MFVQKVTKNTHRGLSPVYPLEGDWHDLVIAAPQKGFRLLR